MIFLFGRKQGKRALAKAIKYRKAGKLDRAEKIVSALLENTPENAALLLEAGRIAFACQEWALAITYLQRSCHNDLAQARPGIILKLAAAYRHLNLFKVADSAVEVVLDHNPFDTRALGEYAAIAMGRNDWPAAAARWVRLAESQAAKMISASFESNPESAALLVELGKFAFLRQDWASAVVYFLRACRNDPSQGSRETNLRLAAAYRRLERFAEAERMIEHLLKQNLLQPDALREHAEIATAQKDWPTAVTRWTHFADVSNRKHDRDLAANRLLRIRAIQQDAGEVDRILHEEIGHDETSILKGIFNGNTWQTKLMPPIAGGHIVAAKIHRAGNQAIFEKIRFDDRSARRERLFNTTFNGRMLEGGVSAPRFYGSVQSNVCVSLFYDAIEPERIEFTEGNVHEILTNLTALANVRPDDDVNELRELGVEKDESKPSPKAFAQVSRELQDNVGRTLRTLREMTHRLQTLDADVRNCFTEFYRVVEQRADRFRRIFEGVPACLNHYDVNRTNVLRCRERNKIFLIDWELADVGPLGYDFGYFLAASSTPFQQVMSFFETRIAGNLILKGQANKDSVLFSIAFHYMLCSAITSAVWISAKPNQSVFPARDYIHNRLSTA